MQIKTASLWQLTLVCLFALSLRALAADSPLETVRATINQVTPILQKVSEQNGDSRQERINKVWEIVESRFDLPELARRALGIHWRERTEGERQEFIKLFTELIKQTYSDTLMRYTGDIQFFFDQERIEGNFATVNTRMFNPALDKTIPIRYRLHRVGNDWLVYDVVIEQVSMVSNYRTQFHRIISRASYEELVQSIQNRLQELTAT